jgi:flagellar biosynthesis protein FliQ
LQEATLSYVPKLLACSAVIILLGPWLLTAMIMMIPQLG